MRVSVPDGSIDPGPLEWARTNIWGNLWRTKEEWLW